MRRKGAGSRFLVRCPPRPLALITVPDRFGADFRPLPAGVVAAQGGDGVGAALGPAHPGQLESLADDGLAAGLDGAGSDEHAQSAEPGVAHPLSVGLEVAERPVDFAGLGVGEGQVSGGGGQGGDVAGVEVGQPGGQPGRVVLAEDGGESLARSCRCSRAW